MTDLPAADGDRRGGGVGAAERHRQQYALDTAVVGFCLHVACHRDAWRTARFHLDGHFPPGILVAAAQADCLDHSFLGGPARGKVFRTLPAGLTEADLLGREDAQQE